MTNSGEEDLFPDGEISGLDVPDNNEEISIGEDDLDKIDEIIGLPKKKRSSGGSLKRTSSKKEPTSQVDPKNSVSKKEKQQQQQKEACRKQVSSVIKKLNAYKVRDEEAVKVGEPAMSKIKHIDEILETLNKQEVQRGFMNLGGLDILKLWLDKIPNGPEPSVSLQKKLLNFIFGLSIQRKHLQGIKLGKVIYRISEKSNVKELKMLASRIVEKWSKILNSKETQDSHSDDDEEEDAQIK